MQNEVVNNHNFKKFVAIGFVFLALFFIIKSDLVIPLFFALLTYFSIEFLEKKVLLHTKFNNNRKITVGIIIFITITLFCLVIYFGSKMVMNNQNDNFTALIAQLNTVILDLRRFLPDNVSNLIPDELDGLKETFFSFASEHLAEITNFTKSGAKIFLLTIIGGIISILISIHNSSKQIKNIKEDLAVDKTRERKIGELISYEIDQLQKSFNKVFFAQAKISLINTTLTAIYLFLILPVVGIELPYAKSIILLTFFCGLLPVVGNLISNAIIVLISLTVSFMAAVISLGYLIIIHKLEYFINAKIIGSQIKSHAFEILLIMVFFEICFGMPGLIIAPFLYGYIKGLLIRENVL